MPMLVAFPPKIGVMTSRPGTRNCVIGACARRDCAPEGDIEEYEEEDAHDRREGDEIRLTRDSDEVAAGHGERVHCS